MMTLSRAWLSFLEKCVAVPLDTRVYDLTEFPQLSQYSLCPFKDSARLLVSSSGVILIPNGEGQPGEITHDGEPHPSPGIAAEGSGRSLFVHQLRNDGSDFIFTGAWATDNLVVALPPVMSADGVWLTPLTT